MTPSGSCATMVSPLPAGARRRRAVRRLGAVRVPRRAGFEPAPRNDGSADRLPRLVPHAARARGSPTAPRRLLERSGAELVRAAAARPLLRLRRHVLGAPAGGVARDGRRQARRRGVGATLVTARSGLPDAPARPRGAARRRACRPPRHRARRGTLVASSPSRGRTSASSRAGRSPTRTCRARSTRRSRGCASTG